MTAASAICRSHRTSAAGWQIHSAVFSAMIATISTKPSAWSRAMAAFRGGACVRSASATRRYGRCRARLSATSRSTAAPRRSPKSPSATRTPAGRATVNSSRCLSAIGAPRRRICGGPSSQRRRCRSPSVACVLSWATELVPRIAIEAIRGLRISEITGAGCGQ